MLANKYVKCLRWPPLSVVSFSSIFIVNEATELSSAAEL